MHKYSARVFWSDEDASYVAHCVEIPGATALGPTPEDATQSLTEVIGLILKSYHEDGDPPPAYLGANHYPGKVTLDLGRELHREAVLAAAWARIPLNTWMIAAIASALGGYRN